MELDIARNWWVWALRGILAIIFGMIAFCWPWLFWLAVVFTFAAYAFATGVLAIVAALTGHRESGPWWALILEGIAGITVGTLTFAWPFATVMTEWILLYLIAFQYISTGVFQLIAAVRLRQHVRNEWALISSGFLSVVLGIAFVVLPEAGALVVAWWVAAYSIVFGALLIAVAFRLRSLARHTSGPEATFSSGPKSYRYG